MLLCGRTAVFHIHYTGSVMLRFMGSVMYIHAGLSSGLLYIFDRRYIALQIATDLSVNQTNDILWIRRLFYRKLGQLARHRKALLSRMTQSQVDTCHASEKLSGLTDWGKCLHQNGLDEYRTWLQFALCLMRGVSFLSASSSRLSGLLVRFDRSVSLQHMLVLGSLSGLTMI